MVRSTDSLETFIDLLPHHRQYHDRLAADLDSILNTELQALTSSAAHSKHNQNAITSATAIFGKQCKRLVNECMATLAQWSKVLSTPDNSDVIASQPPPSNSQLTSTSIHSTITSTNAKTNVTECKQNIQNPKTQKSDVAAVKSHSGTTESRKDTRTSRTTPNISELEDSENPIYNTPQPTYSHIAILVDISFLGVRALERMESKVSTGLFEIEKARSNLINKIINLGMKKRALQELGILREQLITGAIVVWDEPDLMSKYDNVASVSTSLLFSVSISPSNESLQKTYQELFSFPLPIKLVNELRNHRPDQKSKPSPSTDPMQTNAIRCWIDVRSGSLAHLLYPMMTRGGSPYDWCMCIANAQPKVAQQSLDAIFRLLFISAGKVIENNRTREGHRYAFLLRMLGIRYYAAMKHIAGSSDGSIWDRITRCGAEYEKSTREGRTQTDFVVLVTAYKEIFEVIQSLSPVDYSKDQYQIWHKHLAHFAPKVNDDSILTFVRSIDSKNQDSTMIDNTAHPPTASSIPSVHTIADQRARNNICDSTGKSTQLSLGQSAILSRANHLSVDQVLEHLNNAVEALKKFQEYLPTWLKGTLPAKLLLLDWQTGNIWFLHVYIPLCLIYQIFQRFCGIQPIQAISLRMARKMNDQDSLPWISNAFYNYGGYLFKAGQQKEAVRPLELAIESYQFFLGNNLQEVVYHGDPMQDDHGAKEDLKKIDLVAEGRMILASRLDVLGVCFQSLHQLDKALESFNKGLYILPLEAFRQIDHIARGDMKTSQQIAAKLLNRRARTLLMMPQSHFASSLTSIPKFEARLTRHGEDNCLGGIVQEYEVGLLSVLGVKANQARARALEQIEILTHIATRYYPGGEIITHPVRRAKVLVQLAVLYQNQPDVTQQNNALQLVEEAIEILKGRDLKDDIESEEVRNHHLAMAYTWQGILERSPSENGSPLKSKPFQLALQIWEVILSGVSGFVSWDKYSRSMKTSLRSEYEKVRMQIPDPEHLYGHLHMLADCLDSVRIYARIGQAYLALGYSGKARVALDHGKNILEEMSRRPDGLTMQYEVYPIWLLAHSLYLTSIGYKSQGVAAYNQAKQYSQMYTDQAISKSVSTSHNATVGVISKSVETKVQRATVVVEASLARSQLLFFEGNLPESIADAMRALRQLNRIISTLASAIESSQKDSTIIYNRPMDNPFIVKVEPTDRNSTTKSSTESNLRRQGIELLATQRYQWSILRLLSEVYHQLTRLHLAQGSQQETEYFVKEGQSIARLSKASKSLNRFLLDQAHVGLLKHEWEESQQILNDLALKKAPSTVDAMEIQDARTQLLNGDMYYAMKSFNRSLNAYYRTDEILTYLMDKSVISDLEQLVIREPQTPREKKLANLYQSREKNRFSPQKESSWLNSTQGPSDAENLECVSLSEIKASMGYRTSLIFNRLGERAQAKDLAKKSRNEDPMAFTSAEYYFTMAKMLMLDLEDAMNKHLIYFMIPESALSVGLFQRTRIQNAHPTSIAFRQTITRISSDLISFPDPHQDSSPTSSSKQTSRSSRRRRSQLSLQQSLSHTNDDSQQIAPLFPFGTNPHSIQQYRELLKAAKAHLMKAFKSSFHTWPPHIISDICIRLAHLSVLESCFHVEILENPSLKKSSITEGVSKHRNQLWKIASQAACSLEMAKAIAQRREMHGLIKQKLNPTLPHEDQSWPKNISCKDNGQEVSCESMELQDRDRRNKTKTIFHVGLEKPRSMQLLIESKSDSEVSDNMLMDITSRTRQYHNRQEQQELLNQELGVLPSSTLGNDRQLLEELDGIYERDSEMLSSEDGPTTFLRDFVDILPQNWTVVSLTMDVEQGVLYVNRLRVNTMPLVVRLPLNRDQLCEDDGLGLNINLMENADRAEPLTYAGAVDELQNILKESQDTLAIASTAISGHIPATGLSDSSYTSSMTNRRPIELTKEAKTEWWNRRQNLNDRLRILLSTMEDQWLCGLKGIIQSHNTPTNEENLFNFKETLEKILSQAGKEFPATPARHVRSRNRGTTDSKKDSVDQIEINIELCRVILNLGDQPTNSELCDVIHFLLDAYQFMNVATPGSSSTSTGNNSWSSGSLSIEYTEEQFNQIAIQIREALQHYWEVEVASNNNGYDEGAHVILILDKHLQMFPWESCPVLREEAVSRVPSIWFLRDRILRQRHLSRIQNMDDDDLEQHSNLYKTPTEEPHWKDLEVNGRKTFYLLNPGKDLKNTEEEFKDYVQAQPGWEGIIGRTPLDMECIQGLSKNDLYIYFGHSGGEQYIKPVQIRKLGHCAVSILLGCSSGLLRGSGEFDPTGNAMNYMLAGCPTVVASLWDVTDRDLDRFSKALFTYWGLDDIFGQEGRSPNNAHHGSIQTRIVTQGLSDEMETDIDMNERRRAGLQKPRLSIVEAVKEAREECRLKYLVGAATVVYGIPCFLKA
ncbi:hypothetical protein FBU30_008775 [Linnemannia zychae]|nr:hypothetical protein FBU30_008775 [Linnemannia zychae]